MKYTMIITAEKDETREPTMHRPIVVETMTTANEFVTDEEIENVAKFLESQVKNLLAGMTKGFV